MLSNLELIFGISIYFMGVNVDALDIYLSGVTYYVRAL